MRGHIEPDGALLKGLALGINPGRYQYPYWRNANSLCFDNLTLWIATGATAIVT